MSSFVPHYGYSRMAIKIVIPVLAAMVDQEIFLFIDELQNIIFAKFKIRSELNGQSRTRLLAEPSENTTSKIDAEPPGVTTAVLPFG